MVDWTGERNNAADREQMARRNKNGKKQYAMATEREKKRHRSVACKPNPLFELMPGDHRPGA